MKFITDDRQKTPHGLTSSSSNVEPLCSSRCRSWLKLVAPSRSAGKKQLYTHQPDKFMADNVKGRDVGTCLQPEPSGFVTDGGGICRGFASHQQLQHGYKLVE